MTGPRDTNAEDLDLDSKVVTGDALFGAMFEASGVIAGVFELLENDYRYVVANRNTAAFYGRPAGGLDGMTGRQALEAKLVDRLGDREAAVAHLAGLCKIEGDPTILAEPEKSPPWWKRLLQAAVDISVEHSAEPARYQFVY